MERPLDAGRAEPRDPGPLEEVLAISYALGVSPLYMIVPVGREERLRIGARRQTVVPMQARPWLRGQDTLLDGDPDFFFGEFPVDEVRELIRHVPTAAMPSLGFPVESLIALGRRTREDAGAGEPNAGRG